MEDVNLSTSTQNAMQNDFLIVNLSELEWLFDTIDRRILPAVTIGGLFLQSLNFLVLLSKQLRNNAIRFLAAMSLVDVLFLLVQLPFLPVPFISSEGENASPTAAAYYEFVRNYYTRYVLYPLSRVCLATNTWLAVLVSFERYLALRPTPSCSCAARHSFTRRKLSLPAIFAAFILAAGLNVSSFFENQHASGDNSTEGSSDSSIEALEGPKAVARFALTYLLPLVLLLVFNTALVYLLVKYRNKQLRMQSGNVFRHANGVHRNGSRFGTWLCGGAESSRQGRGHHLKNASDSIRSRRHSRSTLSTAAMVLVAMFVHLAFDLPGSSLTVLVFFRGQAVVRSNVLLVLASHASNVLVLVHCSIDWCAKVHRNYADHNKR